MSAAPPQPVLGPWTITYSNAGISQSNTTFYYDDQMIHLLVNHGFPLVNVTLAAIDAEYWYNNACSINYGAQAGGCGVMFFVVLLLSQASKRRTPIYILNVLSLLLGFFRALFSALYFLSPWMKLYVHFANDYSAMPRSAYAISVLSTIFSLAMIITVNLSLVLQGYTVTKSMKNVYRYGITAMSAFVFLLAIGFAFAQTVINNTAIIHAEYLTAQWILRGALYMETISIWYFTIIFTSKLAYTLHYRRKHGWKQWSGVRILASMGGCTMVVPSIFAILEHVDQQISSTFPEAGTISITLVALLLPLSSLWASMAINNETANFDTTLLSGFYMNSGSSPSSSSSHSHNNKRTMPSARRVEYADYDCDDFEWEFSPSTIKNEIQCSERLGGSAVDADVEAFGVRVQKSYSLQSDTEDVISGNRG